MLAVLRVPVYRRLFAAQVVALLGTGLLTVALALLAFDLAGEKSGAVLGTALAIKMVAYVVVAPVMAALVEHLPRKSVMVGADLVRAAIAISLPFIDQTWQIYLLVFILQSASATFTPTFQSLIPAILPMERDYTRALSLSRLAYDLESLASPVLAAALLTVVSFHGLFLGTAAGFLASAVLVAATRLPQLPPPARAGSFLHRTTVGVRLFAREEPLRGLLALDLVAAAGTALVMVNTVVLVRDRFAGSTTDVAVVLACYGAGSMLAALAMPRILGRFTDRAAMLGGGAVLAGAVFAAAAVAAGSGGWPALLLVWGVLGMGTSLVNTPSSRLLRRASTDANRQHLFTAQFSLSHACYLLTYPIAGWVGAQAGQPVAAVVLAVVATLGTAAALRLWPRQAPVPEPAPSLPSGK
ncbi:MFS transporter [Arthrobacter sp. 35W]|uniref:MFS transporter n=1 Tax=Arthrobacter sp. 35W TaxID=1132441 RepID=UPI0004287A8B|nr:MFS transporter [Arthrobacter sp. 35W]